jgi:serine/threonine protein kinase
LVLGLIDRQVCQVSDVDKLYRVAAIAPTLGEGSFGKVLMATQVISQRPMAIKYLHTGTSLCDALHEVTILERLEHPNVIRLLDAWRIKPAWDAAFQFRLMFEHGGSNLSTCMKRGAMTMEKVQDVMGQIVAGMSYVHSQKIIHTDCKPQNILLDADGRVCVCDFGSSVVDVDGMRREWSAEEAIKKGVAEATLWYRPPEVLLGFGTLMFSLDIWSCGCLFGELLTNQVIQNAKAIHTELFSADPPIQPKI